MRTTSIAVGLLALAENIRGQSLPYNPARILLPSNSSNAYIFEPSTQSSGQTRLLAVEITKSLSASQLQSSVLCDTLPFLRDDTLLPYTPTLESDGSITVLTGDCSKGASGAGLWRYASESENGKGKYVWSQHNTSHQQLGKKVTLSGSSFLGTSLAFSDLINGDVENTDMFVFGGMCPTDSSTADTWQSAADYSNSMLTLSPQGSDFDISATANRGPPIPQAGISVTPLPPTYSTDSSGKPLTQQQDFVLLGGHTQSAFINTSQLALFSLPQQSWSFVEVKQPSSAKTDLLARRSTQEVTPRSGHTAVLSESGNSIILFGGWVGDVNTPAQPQLAVLELGAGYGGSGDWKWHVPHQSGPGLSRGSGIYGHGAILLPGDIMMVYGGYEIAAPSSRRMKRDAQSGNSRVLFYNTTSDSWLDSYTPPTGLYHGSANQSGPLSSKSQKVGLGTGLGIGAVLLVSLLAFYFWYSKRLQRARETRERALLTYSSDGSSVAQMDQPFLGGGIDGRGGDGSAMRRSWPTGGEASSSYPHPPAMQHTTGMWVNVPSPTRGLRKGTAGKNYQYQAAPRFDDKRHSMTMGNIHPIAEHENEDGADALSTHSDRDGLSDAEAKLREVERMLTEDPFKDPEPNPLGSHPVGSGDTVRRVPTGASRISVPSRRPLPFGQESANWTVEPGSSDGSYEEGGRSSPSRSDDRTSSTLSERSTASSNSITRTMSTRTGAILAAAVAANGHDNSPKVSPVEERSQTMITNGSRKSISYFKTRARSSTAGSAVSGPPNSAGGDGDSFMTARSNFAQLQSEGEVLLGGRPNFDRDDPYQRALAAHSAQQPHSIPSSYGHGMPPPIPPRRRPGLMGSLRRALNVVSLTDRSFSLTSPSEPYKDDMRSSSSSPTKERGGKVGSTPRRAVSDGGALLKQKRGQKDWSEKDWAPYRDDPDAGDWGEPNTSDNQGQAEEDWDVEGAANKRDFQVMFTVPKARLRVVNDDMDRASLRSASDSAVSRQSSVKDLRREDSVKTVRARSEAGALRLPSTEEEEREEMEKEKAA